MTASSVTIETPLRAEGVAAKVDQALELLASGRDGRPRFLFVHTYQVHMPYTAPEPAVKSAARPPSPPVSVLS